MAPDADGFALELGGTTRTLFTRLRRSRTVRLRLDLAWENSSWQVLLGD
ncbi:MAG: hypothetical protein AVDCRST_MAG48-3724, partial [uncultured Friedmanniella sp.]